MKESEDQLLFEGLELEEPSAPVDEAIIAEAESVARVERQARGIHRGPLFLIAAAAALAPALILLWPERLFDAGDSGASKVAEAASLEDIRELRSDLDQIKEMAELIPPERQVEQETIENRIRACLEDLERLESKLRSLTESSLLPPPVRIGVNI